MRKEVSPEKLLDMTRSILPSKARKSARKHKAAVKRAARRGVRQDIPLHDEYSPIDLTRTVSMRWVVRSRQGADKLNHFMHWCDKLTRGLPLTLKLQRVRALLPNTVVGNHAYGHWKAHCEYRPARTSHKETYQRTVRSRFDRTRHALTVALAKDPTLLGALNADIKRRKLLADPRNELRRRLLHGMHDVDAFVHDVLFDANGCHKIERVALASFRLLA
ncbi:MAG TPA: hypothetical protein VHW00_12560 [Thermoanaerobaculia bacterium]|nr:hypothetical protein [Thermoanaerobaculia bacterium]